MRSFKKLVLILITVSSSPILICQELHSWIPQSLNPETHLNKIQFVDLENGFISGFNSNHAIFGKSSDGGYNWSVNNFSQTWDEVKTYFINILDGWAVTYNGDIFHTTEGGNNWILQNSGTGDPRWDVYFVNSNYGWVVGEGGTRIEATTDGGIHWNNQASPISQNLLGIYFNNINDGWAVGNNGTILRTNDGGTNWLITTNNEIENLKSVFFINTTGWVVGENGAILKSTDNGQNWININTTFNNDFYSVYFINEYLGWIVGEGIIVKTNDGGIGKWMLKILIKE